MKTQYTVCGRLQGSQCSHMVSTSRQRAMYLLKAGLRSGSKVYRFTGSGLTRSIEVPHHSAKELFKGYRYSHLELLIGPA